MRLWTWILSCLFLCACSTHHKIDIPRPPCLYPFYDYDFTLCQPFNYSVNGINFQVPLGFTTDLASIPRLLWSIYSPNKANTIPGAVIHDYLYFCPGEMTRAEADSIFYDALIYRHVNTITAFKYWMAVRVFGSSHFNKGAVCSTTTARFHNTIGHYRNKGTV
jgi:hypothetical protein